MQAVRGPHFAPPRLAPTWLNALGLDDIQAVVEKLHVPHSSRNGVDAIITDLDPKVATVFAHMYRDSGFDFDPSPAAH